MTSEPNDLPAVPIGIEDIVPAAQRLEPRAHRTPVPTSRTLDERSAAGVFLSGNVLPGARGAMAVSEILTAGITSSRAACDEPRQPGEPDS